MKKLRNFLEKNEITITDFAKKLGCSHAQLSRWISGVNTPSVKVVVDIEELTLGIVKPKDWLIENNDLAKQEEKKEKPL